MPIVVAAYDPDWPIQFARIAAELARALDAVAVRAIEHVGSTSVPGLAAKPVIDLDVIVDRSDLEATIGALERIGYEHRGDLGIPDRHALAAPDDGTRRNVYVVWPAPSRCATISPSAMPSGRIGRCGSGTGPSSVGWHRRPMTSTPTSPANPGCCSASCKTPDSATTS